jgi:hypothetical protein
MHRYVPKLASIYTTVHAYTSQQASVHQLVDFIKIQKIWT